MYDIKNPFDFLKELIEQREYLLTFAGKVTSLLGPKDDTRLNFSAWCEEHRIPEVNNDEDLDDLIYQIYEEAKKAYHAEDVMITLKDRYKGQSFDADTVGAILTRFEQKLHESDEYYEAYWDALDEAIYEATYLRCEVCDCMVDKNDRLCCQEKERPIEDVIDCPMGFELSSEGSSSADEDEDDDDAAFVDEDDFEEEEEK